MAKTVLVTGATGFLGWHVARKLLDRGDRVRLLARDPARARELEGAEVQRGDLLDADSLRQAAEGCGTVFHVAADYRLWVRDETAMYRTNVEGAIGLMAAAKRAGVERFVYTSTVGCIGIPKGGAGDETTPVTLSEMAGAYKRSKFLAERAVLEEAGKGFPVVIVNPTAPVGDHDWKPTPTGKIVVEFLRGRMPAYLDTGLNVVDARDVATGHLLAAERGRAGERYILGGENLTLRRIFEKLEMISGVRAPKRRVPYWLAYGAGVVSTAWARLAGGEPRAPLDGVRMARKKMFVSHEKASRELGYDPGPAEEALRRAVEWFRANGYCAHGDNRRGGGR